MLGDKIRQQRKLNHMSQEELAEKLGVSRQSISLWENNQTQPTIENIVVISKLFGISTDELLSESNSESGLHYPESRGETNPIAVPVTSTVTTAPAIDALPQQDKVVVESPKQVAQKKSPKRAIIIGTTILVAVLVLGLFTAWLITRDNSGGNTQLSAEDIYTKISPSVVEVVAESTTETSTGTGFFFDNKGTIITNYHVIEGCQTAEIILANGTTYKVTAVLGYDSNRDIAILATTCKQSTPLSIRTTSVKTGEKVYAIGSSLGLSGSLSDGIVSAVDRKVEGNVYIQTTAPISQGNSGGPLVDSKGEVVGIVCASFTDGQNLNLAIPIADANKISLSNSITLDKLFPAAKREVEWISDWRFQYYADEDTYVLLFQLADKDKVPMSASGTVEIRIVNDNDVTVYSKTHNFTAANFEEWIYDDTDEMYLATIYISPQSIAKGSTEYGTVYFEVYGDGYSFEECTESVFDLPTSAGSAPNNPQQGGTTPDNPQQGGTTNKYTCLSLNCNNAVVKSGDYCSEHKCQNGDCGYEREHNAKYCSVCLCGTAGCLNAKTKNGYYCAEHTCSVTKCQYNKAANEKYCSYHACDICGELRLGTSLYCAKHQSSSGDDDSQQGSTTPPTTQPTQYTCLKLTCKNVVSKSGEYCSEHKCANNNCSFEKDYNSDYCGSCTCNTVSCKKPHIENGYHCTEHTCKASGCTTEKQYSSDYCITHKCNSCNNQKIDNGSYCVDHTCAKNGCNWDKQYGSEYCFKHTCMAGTCKNETLGDGDYCEEHTCIVPGCDKQKLLDDYCYYHTP